VSRGVRVALAIMFGALVRVVHVLRIRAAGSERDAPRDAVAEMAQAI
jgi:hypothetical protein